MDICGLKNNISECYNSILDIILNSNASVLEKKKLIELDWEESKIQEEMFMSHEQFIDNIIEELGEKYRVLNQQDISVRTEFVSIFYLFIGKILNLMREYLPLKDPLIDILDFVELKDEFPVLKSKIKTFNNKFNIIKEEEKENLKSELVKLKDIKVEYYRNNSTSLLHMWDCIEKEEKLELLSKITKVAQTLPTSSASIEQSFSTLKLVKTPLRNKLSQSSLEGIAFVSQEFREKNDIDISQKIIEAYQEVKRVFNSQKSGVKSVQNRGEKESNQKNTMEMEVVEEMPINDRGNDNDKILEELFEKVNYLTIPGEIIIEKPKGTKRSKPLDDLFIGMKEIDGKDMSFKKAKKNQ